MWNIWLVGWLAGLATIFIAIAGCDAMSVVCIYSIHASRFIDIQLECARNISTNFQFHLLMFFVRRWFSLSTWI